MSGTLMVEAFVRPASLLKIPEDPGPDRLLDLAKRVWGVTLTIASGFGRASWT